MKKSVLIAAHVQGWMFAFTMAGFLGLIFLVASGGARLDSASEKLIYTMFGVLGTIVTQQAGYFYARQRSGTGDTLQDYVTQKENEDAHVVVMPQLVGMWRTEAANTLKKTGFTFSTATYRVSDSPADKILNQSPVSGEKVHTSMVVYLVVSKAKEATQ